MALLYPRQSGHSFSTIQERPQQGWDYCMTKAYCKHVSPFFPHPPILPFPLINFQTDSLLDGQSLPA